MEFPAFFESASENLPADQEESESLRPDPGVSFPAPWADIAVPDGERITTINIPDGGPDSGGPPFDLEARDWGETDYDDSGTDAIAFYVPWHSSPRNWGIYFRERQLFALNDWIARVAGVSPNLLAPIVLRQVLFHELTHFRFEVVGSELEDVLGRRLYLSYIRERYGRPVRGLSGPIEESMATWSEVRFSRGRLQQFLRPKPPSYPRALRHVLSSAPPGYRDWRAASSDRNRERLVADIASLIADRPISTGGWGGWVTEENRSSVPRRWIGNPKLLPAVNALEKSAPVLTVRVFERWLDVQGIVPVPARGSHMKFQWNGRHDGYGTSGKGGRLYMNDTKRLSRFFGFPTVADFQIAVSTRAQLVADV